MVYRIRIFGLFGIIFSILSLKVNAQSTDFIGGLLLNFNGIQLEGENEQYWNSQNGSIWGAGGLSVGVFTKREFNNTVYSVLELRYIRKGSIYEYSNIYGNRALELLKLDYVEIPVLVGVKVKSSRKHFYLETGVAYGYLLKSDVAFNKLVSRLETADAANYKIKDISWITDVKFPLNRKENLLLGARVEYSLFSVHRNYNLHNLDYGFELNYLIFAK